MQSSVGSIFDIVYPVRTLRSRYNGPASALPYRLRVHPGSYAKYDSFKFRVFMFDPLPPLKGDRQTGGRRAAHSPAARRGSTVGADGPLKRRSWVRAGIMERASATWAGSMSAVITPGASPPSASTSPQGATIREWP